MSEPKEVLKAMSAVAGARYRSQITIFQQDDENTGSPPPPPPPDGEENTGSPPPPPPPDEGG